MDSAADGPRGGAASPGSPTLGNEGGDDDEDGAEGESPGGAQRASAAARSRRDVPRGPPGAPVKARAGKRPLLEAEDSGAPACLFGRPSSDEVDEFLRAGERHVALAAAEASQRYGFDFERGVPLEAGSGSGEEWEWRRQGPQAGREAREEGSQRRSLATRPAPTEGGGGPERATPREADVGGGEGGSGRGRGPHRARKRR